MGAGRKGESTRLGPHCRERGEREYRMPLKTGAWATGPRDGEHALPSVPLTHEMKTSVVFVFTSDGMLGWRIRLLDSAGLGLTMGPWG